MQKKISIIILFAILSISLISLISADYNDDYIYADNGIVVYPTYILRQVCKPFMPCGVERIDIPNDYSYHNQNNYNSNGNNQEGDGSRLLDELSSPGFSQVIADQRSPTYDPLYKQNQNRYNNFPVIIYTNDDNNNPTPIKHFANTYNTRNNYDSDGNWIEKEPIVMIVDNQNTQRHFKGAVLVMPFQGDTNSKFKGINSNMIRPFRE